MDIIYFIWNWEDSISQQAALKVSAYHVKQCNNFKCESMEVEDLDNYEVNSIQKGLQKIA